MTRSSHRISAKLLGSLTVHERKLEVLVLVPEPNGQILMLAEHAAIVALVRLRHKDDSNFWCDTARRMRHDAFYLLGGVADPPAAGTRGRSRGGALLLKTCNLARSPQSGSIPV
jgi:hypothetical protein